MRPPLRFRLPSIPSVRFSLSERRLRTSPNARSPGSSWPRPGRTAGALQPAHDRHGHSHAGGRLTGSRVGFRADPRPVPFRTPGASGWYPSPRRFAVSCRPPMAAALLAQPIGIGDAGRVGRHGRVCVLWSQLLDDSLFPRGSVAHHSTTAPEGRSPMFSMSSTWRYCH